MSLFEKLVVVGFVVSVLSISGLALASGDGTGSGAGPAHPSALFCGAKSGIYTTVKDVEGEFGICRLKDNSLIEAFTLWRHADQREVTQAGLNFLKATWHAEDGLFEQWALINCERIGGQVLYFKEKLRPQAGAPLCVFKDRSAIEAWTLFAGPAYYTELARVLYGN